MRYKVRDIGPEGLDVRVPLPADFLAAEVANPDVRPAAQGLALDGRLQDAGDAYLLRGKLRGGVVVPCGRCLEPATIALDVPILVSFVEKREGHAQDDDDNDLDAADVATFEDGVIDLGPELHDQLLLALPMSPLCRPDCAGLCPVCGGNRNQTPCACETKERATASKWTAALAKLKS